ncbi:MAG: F-type H+-transporting ATPase subunit delta [Acetobacterium sp.]|nr:F-type H+-transporting ATPase subunit delta [Acetobacterium sp.]
MSLVASKYAQALFDLAIEKNQLEEINSDFRTVVMILDSEEKFLELMLTPSLNTKEKKGILIRSLDSFSNQYIKNYLMILLDKNRFEDIFDIYEKFKRLSNEHRNLLEARVLTAIPLDETLRVALEEKMAKRFNKTVVLRNEIDKSILGGVVVYIGDQIIDGSIKKQLSQMKTQVNNIRLH